MNVVRKNIVSLFVLQGANYLLPLVTVPYLVRVLGPANFGRIAFAQSFIGYFVALTEYGFNLSATRSVALVRENHTELSRLFSAVMIIKAAFMVAGFALMLCLVLLVPQFAHDWLLYVLVYLTVVGNVLFPVWFFQGMEDMRHITLFTISARIVTTAAVFAFVRRPGDYRLAAGFLASSLVIAGIVSLFVIHRSSRLRICWPSFRMLRAVAWDGWHLFLSTAAISLYTSSSVFVLGMMSTPTAVGYFSAAQKIVKAVATLVSPVAQAVYPHVAVLVARAREAALAFAGRVLLLQGGAMLVSSLVLLIFARPVVYVALGEHFGPSVRLVEWMAALPFVIGLSNVLGLQVMLNFGMKRTFSYILVASGLVNVAIIFPLVHWYGTEGAAISDMTTEIIVSASMIVALLRRGLLPRIAIHRGAD